MKTLCDKCTPNPVCYNCIRTIEADKNYQTLKQLFPLTDEQKELAKSIEMFEEDMQKFHIKGIIKEILSAIQ